MGRSRTRGQLCVIGLLLCTAAASGCAYLRCPRIDPTGERIFAEPLVAPPPDYRPEPPPPLPIDDVAVLLAPRNAVAPVGSEVVLAAGVAGPDGYLRTNRRLEWSIAPGGVGEFVAVGTNGFMDWLFGDFNRPRKIDNTFAVGSTSRKYLRLNRGTPTTADDINVLRGQGWITLTSPVEGTSHVTVFAPEVYAWDARTQRATIHWVDAQWVFPPPSINPAGTQHTLTTTVTRHTTRSPCVGWSVRYQILDGPPAGFAPDGASAVEVQTDAAGQASVEVFQKQPRSGTNKVAIQVIRPAAVDGPSGERLVVGSGMTQETWTSPDLAVRKTGPAVASVGSTLAYRIEVANPGDLPAQNVVLVDDLPPSLVYVSSNPPGQDSVAGVQWNIPSLGARQAMAFELVCRAVGPGPATNTAEATADGGLKARAAATTTVMSPAVDVRVTGPAQATVGSQVTFTITVTNHSQVPLGGLLIKDRFGAGLEHAVARSPIERELGDLAPNESRQIEVTFRATQPGRLCHTVEVLGADGVKGAAEGCVMVVGGVPGSEAAPPSQPPTARATVKITKTGPTQVAVGETARFAIEVTNTGAQALTGVKVVDQYDASMEPVKATAGHKRAGATLVWTIDSLAPGKKASVQVHCQCKQAAARACNRAIVTTQEGARDESEACVQVGGPGAASPGPAAPGQAPPGPTETPAASATGLSLTVTGPAKPVAVGRELTYVIQVANQGVAPHKQVTVVATVPIGMMPTALGTSGAAKANKFQIDRQKVRFDPIPQIGPGETITYRVRVRARMPNQMIFRAEATTADPPQTLSGEAKTEVVEQ